MQGVEGRGQGAGLQDRMGFGVASLSHTKCYNCAKVNSSTNPSTGPLLLLM